VVETIWMSVVAFASFGLTLMKAAGDMAAIEDPINVSPPNTVAIFSSEGSMMRVDCKRPARMTGGVCASDTVTERGAFGSSRRAG